MFGIAFPDNPLVEKDFVLHPVLPDRLPHLQDRGGKSCNQPSTTRASTLCTRD